MFLIVKLMIYALHGKAKEKQMTLEIISQNMIFGGAQYIDMRRNLDVKTKLHFPKYAAFILTYFFIFIFGLPNEANAYSASAVKKQEQNISFIPYIGEDILFLIPADEMESRISSESLGDFINLANDSIKEKIQNMPNKGAAFGYYVIGCLPDGKLKSWVMTYDTENMAHYSGEITNILNNMKVPSGLKGPILFGRYFTIYGGGSRFDIQNFPAPPNEWQSALTKSGGEINDEVILKIVNGK